MCFFVWNQSTLATEASVATDGIPTPRSRGLCGNTGQSDPHHAARFQIAPDAGLPHGVDRLLPLLFRLVRHRAVDGGGPRRAGADERSDRLVHHRLGRDHDPRATLDRLAVRAVWPATNVYVVADLGLAAGNARRPVV